MSQKITILVTGGTGLIGKGIQIALNDPIYNLQSKNETWIFAGSKDADLKCYESTKLYFETVKPSFIIHLAAKVGGLFNNMRNNLQFFRENMKINDNVLLCAHNCGVKKVISCLSTCIFPDKTSYPIDESMIHNGPPHDSNYGYSYAKRMLTILNRGYNVEPGYLYTSVIPTNVYGPYDNFNISDGHVLPGLIHKTYLAKYHGHSLEIWGTGSPLRQFIYSIDIGRLLIWAIRNYNDTEPIILSVDESDEISIKDVSQLIVNAMQFDGIVKFDSTKSDGQYKKTANNSKLRKLIENFQFTPIDKGIQETCDWFIKHYNEARK